MEIAVSDVMAVRRSRKIGKMLRFELSWREEIDERTYGEVHRGCLFIRIPETGEYRWNYARHYVGRRPFYMNFASPEFYEDVLKLLVAKYGHYVGEQAEDYLATKTAVEEGLPPEASFEVGVK